MEFDPILSVSPTDPIAEIKVTPGHVCLNCETQLNDQYCPRCGQKDIPRRQTIGDLLINFISSFWSYESKVFLTGKYLLFRPGQLPLEYNEGKRERYYHPARMYVFISFVYFLLIVTLPEDSDTNNNINVTPGTDSVAWKKGYTIIGDYESVAEYDSLQRTLPADERDAAIKRSINRRFATISERYKGKGEEFNRDFGELFFSNTPRVFFLLLPVFALILRLLYLRRDYFYSEHLIFSVYYYNFFFLAGSIYMLVDLIPVVGAIAPFFGLWIGLYMLFAMKRMYKQPWGKTIAKYGAFVLLFSIAIMIGLVGNLLITLAFI
jgi:hypothetical protein